MARPRHEQPTPAELEVLKILWEQGPCSVRDVMDVLNRTADGKSQEQRAYTSVMSLLNVMFEKQLVDRTPRGRAFIYQAAAEQRNTLRQMVGDLWNRAFEKSTDALIAHLLEQADPTEEELSRIRATIDSYQKEGRRP